MANIVGTSNTPATAAVKGENTGAGGFGVFGVCATGHGVHGESTTSKGVVGISQGFQGVFGKSRDNAGVVGESAAFHAVFGISHSVHNGGLIGLNDGGGWGVIGRSDGNVGVSGESKSGRGVHGISETWQGVFGQSIKNSGLVGESQQFHAIFGVSHSPNNGGVLGSNDGGGWGVIGRSDSNTGVSGESATGVGVHGKGGRLAALFEGDVEVTGDLRLTNADCAEDFDVLACVAVEAGTVMVLDDEGALSVSSRPYDKRVAGVISGAGAFRPAIVLDKQPQPRGLRQPLALVGKVYCRVDAGFGAIAVGDLLTTSATPGHAMLADDASKAFGAVIGKALRPLREGCGLIPILVALQ
jgi:hypothetical protein